MILLSNPKAQYLANKSRVDAAIKRVLNSGWYILGQEVKAFEREFAEYIGCKYAVGVASGTEALSIALVASGVKPGDHVVLPANSYPTVFAVSTIGAIPKLIDANPKTYELDETLLERAIDRKTKAIIPVHLYGQSANLTPILNIARKYNIPVIEDCAQAHGALYKGKKVGVFGKLGCFSFYPTKNLGAIGDGGMIVSNSKQLIERVKLLRMYGEKTRYQSVSIGYNSRLDELQAAILRVYLKSLDGCNKRRRVLATAYTRFLKGVEEVVVPYEASSNVHVFHLYVILCKKRAMLQDYLKKTGIGTGIHYPVPIHLQETYRNLGYKRGDFPEAERIAQCALSLPIYPTLQIKQIRRICQQIRAFYDK